MQHTLHTKNEIQKVELLSPLKSSLLSIYPEKEGWKLYNRYSWANRVFDFVLQKEENNSLQRIVVEINFENHINIDHISNINELADKLSTKDCSSIKKVIIVDDLATFDKAPNDVEVILLGNILNNNLFTVEPLNPKLVA